MTGRPSISACGRGKVTARAATATSMTTSLFAIFDVCATIARRGPDARPAANVGSMDDARADGAPAARSVN